MRDAEERADTLQYASPGARGGKRGKPPFVTGWDLIVIGVIALLGAALLGWIMYVHFAWEPM